MNFSESISTCFKKYVDFSGRASRSEFWWFFLFRLLVQLPTMWIPLLGFIVFLVLLLPTFSSTARRLHDVNRTGWWMLMPIISLALGIGAAQAVWEISIPMAVSMVFLGLIGIIVLFVFLMQSSDPSSNRYGPNPLQPEQGMATMAIAYKPSISSPQPAEGSSVSAYDTDPTDSLSDPEPAGRCFCAQCGAQLQPDARFCSVCGAAV